MQARKNKRLKKTPAAMRKPVLRLGWPVSSGHRTLCDAKKSQEMSYSVNLPTDYEVSRKFGRELRQSMRLDLTGLVAFHALNKIKEIELRRRIAEGKNIRVAFFLDSIAKFTGANIYHVMAQDPLFNPFVVLYSIEESLSNPESWEAHQLELKELVAKGFAAFSGYDEGRNYIPLELFRPDIVFVAPFYLDSCSVYLSNTLLNINFLVCQLNYGFNVINDYRYHFNNRMVNTAWKYFTVMREDLREMRSYSMHYGLNAVYAGSPRLDDYAKPLAEVKIPLKIDNGRPIVIYAPHWTVKFNVNVHDLGTFDLYHDYFLKLAKDNPDINFVFKPHPSLELIVDGKGIMTRAQYLDYTREWDSLSNGLHIFGGDYIDLFRKSSLLITDSASFIFEWLPSGHPCMYLANPRRDADTFLDGFEVPARRILRNYYMCWNLPEIERDFSMIMREMRDPKKEKRLELAREMFPEPGHSSQYIVDYIKTILRE